MNKEFRQLFREIETQLRQVDIYLQEVFNNSQEVFIDSFTSMLKAGGKRVRPAFTLLSARYGSKDTMTMVPLAAAVEMIHMASLVHDDIIDNSEIRRGKQTIRADKGNNFALNFGDILFTKALSLVNEYNNSYINRLLAKASMEMSMGEMEQILSYFDFHKSIKDYLYRVKRKTSYLISYSCQVGAIAGGADSSTVAILGKYGHYIGMSYQIMDDVLDFTAEEDKLGKPIGRDLKQGIVNLPVILALQTKDVRIKSKLLYYLDNKNLDNDSISEVVNSIKEAGAIEQSLDLADRYINKALNVLEYLPQNLITNSLSEIALFIQRRVF